MPLLYFRYRYFVGIFVDLAGRQPYSGTTGPNLVYFMGQFVIALADLDASGMQRHLSLGNVSFIPLAFSNR